MSLAHFLRWLRDSTGCRLPTEGILPDSADSERTAIARVHGVRNRIGVPTSFAAPVPIECGSVICMECDLILLQFCGCSIHVIARFSRTESHIHTWESEFKHPMYSDLRIFCYVCLLCVVVAGSRSSRERRERWLAPGY